MTSLYRAIRLVGMEFVKFALRVRRWVMECQGMSETADIVVVGGGCIGAAIALHLAEQQAGKVLLLEQKQLANGASGKGIGIIRTHYTHPVLAKLAYASLQLFHNFEERFGGYDSGFNPCGYFILVGDSDVDTLKDVVSMHQPLGIDVQMVSPAEAQAQMPFLRIDDVAAAAYEPNSGYGSPPKTTIALANRAAELGVEVRTETPVTGIKLDLEGRIEAVSTPTGDIATRTVVDCVGPWARKFTEALGLPFPVSPVVEHVVVMERPTEYAAPHPVVSDLVNLCYVRSDADQPYTRIGNSDPKYHPQFLLPDADQFHGQQFPDICETLQQKLIRRCPILETAPVVETYSGIWGITPDYQPIIDRLDHIPGLYCAVGFSGHGYKLSPIIGDLMSRFILGKIDDQVKLLDLFRFSRFQENSLIQPPIRYARAGGLR
ncbi:FAD-binding oxidoreductase [Oculatella sp. FACHB-28]|uniref:NAD(P)/FAD-dependent oxidoreductase n=1 Tax=Oculatella sp. FACHB-28 TaxID=2692845 RepID=UPI00168387BC|nr:FAD-dependent oxidoreductase [Oculatella sp. FACHB-28]MBD2055560.1 FAD-binding oxidoreductase [Oculatella sp. FACHB-28]